MQTPQITIKRGHQAATYGRGWTQKQLAYQCMDVGQWSQNGHHTTFEYQHSNGLVRKGKKKWTDCKELWTYHFQGKEGRLTTS